VLPTKIVALGAGSNSFGLNTLSTVLRSERLKGSHLALVDKNEEALRLVERLAQRMNREWDAAMTITAHSSHVDALEGAQFVIMAIEVPPREALWRSDWEIPLKYGVRQPYAENGGPGAFAHTSRNLVPIMEIVRDMEQICPDALLINFTNPMQRICDAVTRYSSIQCVGLCHQIFVGYAMVGLVLATDLGIDVQPGFTSTRPAAKFIPAAVHVAREAEKLLDIKAAGVNHFTWMLDVREKATGRDLYPLFAERWANYDPAFEPLTRRVYEAFGVFPMPGDEHLCEYLPWVSDPRTQPWQKYDISLYEWDEHAAGRDSERERIGAMGRGELPIADLRSVRSEGAAEVVENVAGAGNLYRLAVNVPNEHYITNLPDGAVVEVPGVVTAVGVLGIGVGDLPEGPAELCRREITATRLCVDAAVTGDRQAALQCLLLDPVITDMDVARNVLDDYLTTYRQYLPQFWQ
jgi:alpha-galactosidase